MFMSMSEGQNVFLFNFLEGIVLHGVLTKQIFLNLDKFMTKMLSLSWKHCMQSGYCQIQNRIIVLKLLKPENVLLGVSIFASGWIPRCPLSYLNPAPPDYSI